MNKEDLEILVNTLSFRDKPPEYAVRLLEETCERTGLDWKARHVYLMCRGGKWNVTLSIDGFRMIGSQAPDYAGQEGPFWAMGPESGWSDIPPDGIPYAAKVGVRKKDGTTTWGVAKYTDYKASSMWDKFPSTMVAKCAEMLAWRKTFPGRLGGLYGLEEMAQADRVAAKVIDVKLANGDESSRGGPEADWILKLNSARNRAELLEVGKQITADKSLEIESTLRLHTEFTRIKTQMEG